MFEYNFTQEEFERCVNFSNEIDTSFYSRRNQDNNEKRKKDQLIGKLGEILSYNYLINKIKDLSYPDFNIYDKKNKSWDFDLKGIGFNIHVKSQDISQSKKYGESWIFQAGGKYKGYDKEIFDKISPNQFICFCIIDLDKNFGKIKSICKLEHLHENNLFKLPKVVRLQEMNKLAVYFDDLGDRFDI